MFYCEEEYKEVKRRNTDARNSGKINRTVAVAAATVAVAAGVAAGANRLLCIFNESEEIAFLDHRL